MLIAISKYKKSLAEVDVHRPAHWEYLKSLFDAKKLLVSGRQNPPVGGVIIANKATLEEFKQILDEDPFSKAGVAEYQIIDFDPSFYDNDLKVLLDK